MLDRFATKRMHSPSQILPWAILAAMFLPGGFLIGGSVLAVRIGTRILHFVRRFGGAR